MADCDSTVCAELQRREIEMWEEADEGENKNTTKKGQTTRKGDVEERNYRKSCPHAQLDITS